MHRRTAESTAFRVKNNKVRNSLRNRSHNYMYLLPQNWVNSSAFAAVPNYTAWWQRHMGVNNLPIVVTRQRQTGDRTRDLLIASRRRVPYSNKQKVCRYNWHSAGSLGWPRPVLKYKYIIQIKYTEAILSNSTRKLLRFEISKILTAVTK